MRHFCFYDEEDCGLSDEERSGKDKKRPKHTRRRIHQAKKLFVEFPNSF
ncbi:hypothetical protein [Bacteroides gallinaceum]|nr:hypothetical protein [Bacteroides gallinaceum]MBM6657463.1 hypothetical protein [Bacteroides gallinaceum]